MIDVEKSYLVTTPAPLVSIFLNRAVEKKDGSLQKLLVIDLNSTTVRSKTRNIKEKIGKYKIYIWKD